MTKWVYSFGDGKADGNAEMKNLLGGKGANLAEMSALGLPVPPGFTITTEVCSYYYANEKTYPDDLADQMNQALDRVEEIVGAKFNDPSNPAFDLGSLGRASFHARHDGHGFEPGPQ